MVCEGREALYHATKDLGLTGFSGRGRGLLGASEPGTEPTLGRGVYFFNDRGAAEELFWSLGHRDGEHRVVRATVDGAVLDLSRPLSARTRDAAARIFGGRPATGEDLYNAMATRGLPAESFRRLAAAVGAVAIRYPSDGVGGWFVSDCPGEETDWKLRTVVVYDPSSIRVAGT